MSSRHILGRPRTGWRPVTHRLGKGAFNQVFPHAGDKFIGAPGAVLDGGNENRYAFSGHAPDVTISFLTVQNFGSAGQSNNEGVVNHDSAKGWTVESSTIQKNAGAGVMLGSGNRLIGNCLRDNGQYGFNAYHADGVRDVVLHGNEISGNNTDDWESRKPGCGCTGGGKFWATNGARVTDNYVHDNRGSRPLGGLEQRRVSLRGQLHLGQRRRGHHVRDQLQRSDPEQHTRPERTRQGTHQPGIPGLRDLPLGVGK